MEATLSLPAPAQPRLSFEAEKLRAFCRKHGLTRLELFGSVLRDDFDPNRSDVDVLFTKVSGKLHTFADELAMEEEIAEIFGRRVDLVDREWIERSSNLYRRNHILRRAVPFYVEG